MTVHRSSSASPAAGAAMARLSAFPLPSPEEQREVVMEAMKLEMSVGQVWYVLCSKWFQLWKVHVEYPDVAAVPAASVNPVEGGSSAGGATAAATANGSGLEGGNRSMSAAASEGRGANGHGVVELTLEKGSGAAAYKQGQATAIASSDEGQRLHRQESMGGPGPIDNRTLMGEGRDLRNGMMEAEDYVLLNNRVYELLEAWYGGGPRFKRWVISLGSDTRSELTVELFPIKFFVYLCLPNGRPDPKSRKVQLYSRIKTMRQICADVKSSLNLTPKVDTRLSLKKLEADQDGGVLGESAQSTLGAAETMTGLKEKGATSAAAAVSTASVVGSAKDGETNSSADSDSAVDDGWQEIHLEEVSQSLDQVMGDTQSVALLVETRDVSDPARNIFPRDPIILRWRYVLKEGDLLDARDDDKRWFEGRVVEVIAGEDSNKIKVHFLGWADRWDQIFERSSLDLQKLHTYTTHWRADLRVNSDVEICGTSVGKRKWYAGKVESTKYENGVRVLEVSALDVNGRRWVAENSEEICEVGTHTNIAKATHTRQRSGSGSFSTGTFYRTHTKGKPLARGSVGLTNLGNTCFMNSMLQCLLSTESLSTYFRNLAWKNEMNEKNPLGMGGKVAEAYADLNDAVWSGEYSVVVPNHLKRVVAQYAPMFSGYNQHDAGELMSFLLDGIHEDLNRVHKKPYMEPVDSAGREDAVIADESWRRYLMRNDSIMVDVCTGLLRSHVTCPMCQHASVTFDPYTSLSLPLPVEDAIMVEVLFHPMPYGTRPMMMAFTLSKESKVRELKTMLCERINKERQTSTDMVKTPSTAVALAAPLLLREDFLGVFEVWSSRVFKRIEDAVPVSDMKDQDDFAVCELEFPEEAIARSKATTVSSVVPVGSGGADAGSGSANTGMGATVVRPLPLMPVASWPAGSPSSQAAGDAQGKECLTVARKAAGQGNGQGGVSESLVIDVVLSTGALEPLKGGPRRMTCREGVTNREIHEMIRQHVSRFVPSLKTKSLLKTTQVAMTAPAKATTAVGGETAADGGGAAGTPSSSSPLVATESVENDCMLVDENESQEPVVLQEAGISSTSDIGSDYVHVTAEPMMAVDSDTRDSTTTSTATTTATSNGHYDDDDDVELRDMNYSGGSGSSPFVHVKKKPATTSTMGERATSGTAEMEAGGGGGGGVGGGGVVAADSGEIVDEEEPEDEVWNDVTTVASSPINDNDGVISSSSTSPEPTDPGAEGGMSGGGDAVLVAPEGPRVAVVASLPSADGEAPSSTVSLPVLLENGSSEKGAIGVSSSVEAGEEGKVKEGARLTEGLLPYQVFVTDNAGSCGAPMTQLGVPVNDEPFDAGDKPHGYSIKSKWNEATTLKVQFRKERLSELDSKEMDAFDEHPALAEAKAEKDKRLSIPLASCFAKYTEREQLGQSELWYCGKCKTHRQAHKKLDVYTAPDVLIVVLKRFYSPGNSLTYRQKLNNHVTFPTSGLDLTSYIKGVGGPVFEEAPPIYDLYAVSEHSGSLRAGHYTAIAMNSEDKKWYSFNDSSVSETSPDRCLGSLPYVLFYKRRKGALRWAGMGHEQNHA